MGKINFQDYNVTFKKQIAYNNRTILNGYYNFMNGAEKFEVVKNGHVWEFSSLVDACFKFNEISDTKD